MSYIGNTPAENYASFLTQTFSVTATASYTLDHAVSNENDIRLVINNVVQQPGSGKAYTASGTTLTLSEATASTDVMYCVYLGRALQTVNPPNASVGTSQLADGAVTSAKMFSGFANGITEADQFRLTANITSDVDPISSNLERVDNATFSKIGTGMSLSSGTFTFPTSGLYHVMASMQSLQSGSDTITVNIKVTANNSSYDVVAVANNGDGGSSRVNTATTSYFVNVTNTSNIKVRFAISSLSSGTVIGSTDQNQTCFTFIRLGDSQ